MWYGSQIAYLAAQGIVSGSGGNFDPDGKVTRAQLVTMVCNTYGIAPATDLSDNFADVPDGIWYAGYVAEAKRRGIVSGSGGNFNPDGQASREEMFVLLYNALEELGELPEGTSGLSPDAFADWNSVSGWARERIAYLTQNGVIEGTVSGGQRYLNPANITSRAEMAAFFYNLIAA
jgi:hypothetical protein